MGFWKIRIMRDLVTRVDVMGIMDGVDHVYKNLWSIWLVSSHNSEACVEAVIRDVAEWEKAIHVDVTAGSSLARIPCMIGSEGLGPQFFWKCRRMTSRLLLYFVLFDQTTPVYWRRQQSAKRILTALEAWNQHANYYR